uniref:Uncharacterized protein n=1 Tax=Lygus hesperus TaxID=30085 RepID=A0A146M7M7_LYGHE
MLDTQTRLRVAHGFAKCCYLIGNHRMGVVLLHSVQHIHGDVNPSCLAEYAASLRQLSVDDKVRIDAATDIETGIAAICKVFRRTASLIVAHKVIDDADHNTQTNVGVKHESGNTRGNDK